MNDFFVLIYVILYRLNYLNLLFNYTSRFHRVIFFGMSVKKGDRERFCKTAEVTPMERCYVILKKGMIALLTVISVI